MIVLIGYMGSGKSSVAQYLNSNYSLSYCDLDDYIENEEQKSISEIFEQKGEIYFRKIENLYLKELLTQNRYQILSLGGGTPCYANNSDLLKKFEVDSVYLKVDLDMLTYRLFQNKQDRPLICNVESESQLKDFIRKHLFEREFYYRQARYIINVTEMQIGEIAKSILNKVSSE